MKESDDLSALTAGVQSNHRRSLARAVSIVENGGSPAQQMLEELALLAPHQKPSHVIGLTGAPGVGKSTLTAALIQALREDQRTVAVLAVDPSSPFSGGALLGDRVRMQTFAGDGGVFIRSMSSRGHLGGLALAASNVLLVLEVAGFDVILVETVGVGQSEVDVAATADTAVVLVAPGMGDGVQAAKAGILEIGDVFVVNKADRPGADGTARDLRQMLSLAKDSSAERPSLDRWNPQVLTCVASEGSGVGDVLTSIDEHYAWSMVSGAFTRRRMARARDAIVADMVAHIRGACASDEWREVLDDFASDVASRRAVAHQASVQILRRMADGTRDE